MSYLDDDDKCNDCDKQYKSKYDAKYKWCKPCQINNIKQNFTNWTSGNERIDNLIQEIQLEINELDDMIFEWIPYDQFIVIKELGEGFNKVYSAIWKDGPLEYDKYENKYTRYQQNKKVTLKLYNLQDIINEFFIDQDKKYSITYISEVFRMYGMSQHPNTKDYIIVFQEIYCKKCGKKYTNIIKEWCKSCQIYYFRNNLTSSGNEIIDYIIEEIQLKTNYESSIIFEWIPYDHLNDIREISKDVFGTLYCAIWGDGPLRYNNGEWVRKSNKLVTLKYLYNSENIIKLLNKVKINYSKVVSKFLDFHDSEIYGISQNPDTEDYIMVFPNIYCKECNEQYKCKDDANYEWCKLCQLNNLKQNFTNWTSGNDKIDCLIQEVQLEIKKLDDIIIEWIPYNQLNNIKEKIFTENYLAIWEDGPLKYSKIKNKYARNQQNIKVTLKSYNDYQNNITYEFLNKVKEDLNKYHGKIFGISQNPYTKSYIMILQDEYNEECNKCGEEYLNTDFNWCRLCHINYLKKFFANRTSGNEIIDNFIKNRQLKISFISETILEFIPFNQFNNIKEINNNDFARAYSAIWKDGPLLYLDKKWVRESNKKVYLKLYSLQDTDEFLDEVKKYLSYEDVEIYGISQNQNTKDYIIVSHYNLFCERCGEEYTEYNNSKYEWCIYCQVNDLSLNFGKWTSENQEIDNLIQEMQMQLENNRPDDIIFEWIPYDQFNNIKKINDDTVYSAIWNNDFLYFDNLYNEELIKRLNLKVTLKYSRNIIDEIEKDPVENFINKKYGISQDPITKDYIMVFKNQYCKGGFATIYSAIWKEGPLSYNGYEYIRNEKKVVLKQLDDSQNITIKFLDEIREYSICEFDLEILSIYGISQNPNTKDYIMILDYAEGGDLYSWVNKHYDKLNWLYNIKVLLDIIRGLNDIHENKMVHRDLHTGNILSTSTFLNDDNIMVISDMGLCGKVDDINETDIYGVIPYMAPEVLRGNPYTKAADIYSFGMIMYFVATGRQPFANRAHDETLVIDICCEEIRPNINDQGVPECYIDLMKRCWDSNPDNRPKVGEVNELIELFQDSYAPVSDIYGRYEEKEQRHYDIEKQFKKADEYKESNFLILEERRQSETHQQAIYVSRLLNPYTECLDCAI
ncbi:kinase-like domain-containing protein [Rhizophagus clarus]|uniref:Kinase-like domain-containing protein n=1 Tax=Rhizophagus clarus TaxID=94130 RepID=A0A8H3LX09_9GLOM|nr:kinase-like domain-containing protein [Rhizophagus clarus]